MEQVLTQLAVKILFYDSIDFDEMRWTIILRDFRNALILYSLSLPHG